MSKKAKAANKEKRLQRKRAIKNANKARYAELQRIGQNTKSRRYLHQSKRRKLVKMLDHKDGFCGNLACKKCFPSYGRAA
jgi:hypothetical protein